MKSAKATFFEEVIPMENIAYGFGSNITAENIESAAEKTTAALGEVGFGVLTRIDVHTTHSTKTCAPMLF